MAFLSRCLLSPLKLIQLPHEVLAKATFCAADPSKGKSAAPAKEKQSSSSEEKQANPPSPKEKGPNPKTLLIYRYNPETPQNKPHMQKFEIDMNKCGGMVLDALTLIKAEIDPTLSFRRSCREAICGCCAVNIRGVNSLACITPLAGKEKILRVYPLPHMYVLRDLVTDQTHFFAQYARVQPWLQRRSSTSGSSPKSLLQSERDRAKLDGLYECILCGCCSASCPAYWWHYEKFLGPAILMQAYRWVIDSRDQNTARRLRNLSDYFSVYRCHTIMNCTSCCPKNLNPGRAIAELKRLLIGHVKKQCPDM